MKPRRSCGAAWAEVPRSPSCWARGWAPSPIGSPTPTRCPTPRFRTGRRRRWSATPARWCAASSAGRRVLALAGRAHFYEGHDLRTVTFGTRVLGRLGVKTLVLTNAAGGINTIFAPGTLMVIDDHINLMGSNPLVGPNDERFGVRFPDMTAVYAPRLRAVADDAARGRRRRRATRHLRRRCTARATRRRPRSAAFAPSAPTPSACPRCPRPSSPGTWGSRCSASRASPTRPPASCPSPLHHDEVMEVARRVRGEFIALLEAIVDRV